MLELSKIRFWICFARNPFSPIENSPRSILRKKFEPRVDERLCKISKFNLLRLKVGTRLQLFIQFNIIAEKFISDLLLVTHISVKGINDGLVMLLSFVSFEFERWRQQVIWCEWLGFEMNSLHILETCKTVSTTMFLELFSDFKS